MFCYFYLTLLTSSYSLMRFLISLFSAPYLLCLIFQILLLSFFFSPLSTSIAIKLYYFIWSVNFLLLLLNYFLTWVVVWLLHLVDITVHQYLLYLNQDLFSMFKGTLLILICQCPVCLLLHYYCWSYFHCQYVAICGKVITNIYISLSLTVLGTIPGELDTREITLQTPSEINSSGWILKWRQVQ